MGGNVTAAPATDTTTPASVDGIIFFLLNFSFSSLNLQSAIETSIVEWKECVEMTAINKFPL